VQGGAEMGAYTNVLPGGRPLDDAAVRGEFEAMWGFDVPTGPALHTVAMVQAAEQGELDAMYIVGGNFLETLPQPERVERALAKLPLRIHQDIVLTPQMLVEPQDEVWLLPARTRYEQEGGGTETTTERRVVYSPHISGHDVGEARSEWRIVLDLVRAARPERAHLLAFDDADAIRAEIARAVPQYRGIERFKARGDAFQYGGRHLCVDGQFPLPGGRARFWPVAPPLVLAPEGALMLSTRRGKQFNSIIQADFDALTGAHRDDILMSVDDARARGLSDGQRVLVRSVWGQREAVVRCAAMHPGNAQMHWPEANGLLPPDRTDPHGGVPDYNAAVFVEARSRDA